MCSTSAYHAQPRGKRLQSYATGDLYHILWLSVYAGVGAVSKEHFNIFENKEDALEAISILLNLVKVMAERHSVPFLAALEHDNWLTTFKNFPEDTCSELHAAWYEFPGEVDK